MIKISKRRGKWTAVARAPSKPFTMRYRSLIERMLDEALAVKED